MGKKDISLAKYFEDRERYADLINGFIFDGESVVSEDDIQEMDSRVIGGVKKLRERFVFQKFRDSVRKVVLGMNFAIIGIENQDKIHHGMPVRIMVEDAASYDKQLRQILKRHRKRRDLNSREFIGGFAGCDKIYPVVTICIYYGEEPYNGAKELFQIMDYESLPKKLKPMVNNYKIQVLEINNFKDIHRFKTDLHEVFGFIQCSKNKEKEQAFFFENENRFNKLEEDATDVITTIAGLTNTILL